MRLIINMDWTIRGGILFGILCSPVYPMAIIDLLKKHPQTKQSSVLLGAEGLFGLIMADIAYTIIVGNQGEFVVYWYQFFSITLRFLLIGKLSVLYIVSSCCHFTRYFIWLRHRALRALSLPNDVHEPTKRLYYQLCITICHVLDF